MERVVISTEHRVLDEVFSDYKKARYVFERPGVRHERMRRAETGHIIGQMAWGMPFAPVFLSEEQDGRKLVLDPKHRFQYLLEYLEAHEGEAEMQKILFSSVILHEVDYYSPRYQHMRVARQVCGQEPKDRMRAFEDWVFGALYKDELERIRKESGVAEENRMLGFLYYLCVGFCVGSPYHPCRLEGEKDRYQVLEETLREAPGMALEHCGAVYRRLCKTRWGWTFEPEEDRAKELAFLDVLQKGHGTYNPGSRISEAYCRIVKNCDMGVSAIQEAVRKIREL